MLVLEGEPQSKLNLPRTGPGRPNLSNVGIHPERSAAELKGICGGNAEIGAIEQVEELRSELQPVFFRQLKALVQRKIYRRHARTNQGVPTEVSEPSYLIVRASHLAKPRAKTDGRGKL